MFRSFRSTVIAAAVALAGVGVGVGVGVMVDSVDARIDESSPVVAAPGIVAFQEPHIAYNPDRDESLIVYEATPGLEIRAVRVAGDGTPLGPPIVIADNSALAALGSAEAKVVYNPVSKQYLVWFGRGGLDSPPGTGRSSVIRGVAVSDTGSVVGSERDLYPRQGAFYFCDAIDADIGVHPDGRYIMVNLRRYATTSAGGDCVGLTASQSQVMVSGLTSSLDYLGGTTVSTPAIAGRIDPRVAVSDDGAVLVAWRESGSALQVSRFSSDLMPLGTTTLNYEQTAPGTLIFNLRPLFDAATGNWMVFSMTPFGGAATHIVGSNGDIVRDAVITGAFRLRDVANLGNGTYAIVNTSNGVWHLDGATGELIEMSSPMRAPLGVKSAVTATGDPKNPRATVVGLDPDSGALATAALLMYPPGSLPLVPGRVLDTRTGPDFSTVDGNFEGIGKRTAGSTLQLDVAGRAGVPVGASAVQMNIAAAGASVNGFVTAFPCGASQPTTSNLNFSAGAASSAAAFAKLSDDGKVCLFVSTDIELIVDVNGFVPGTASVTSLVPTRLLESRPGFPDGTVDGMSNGDGRVTAGSTTKLVVTGRGGVPADAVAVIVNVTAVRPSAQTFVTVFPCGATQPTAASLNAATDSFVNNLVLAKVGDDGQICLFSNAETHLIVDVTAYVPTGGGLASLSPGRLFESRPGQRTIDGMLETGARIAAGSTTKVKVAGRAGVPVSAVGAMLNVAAIKPTGNGFLTVFPCNAAQPNAANVNWSAGSIVSNAVFVKLDGNGEVCVFATAETDLTVDVGGYTVDG